MGRTLVIEHQGKSYSGQIAVIKKTEFGVNDHGIMSADLHCEWEGGGIGVGGYCLDTKPNPETNKREGSAYGLDFIMRILDTVGVYTWEKLVGQKVVVLFEEGKSGWGGTSCGIANILNDKVFLMKEHADAWRARSNV